MASRDGTYQFERIQLKNWKNFSDINLKLAPRVFLVGPNASGKSNFLDVFRFLRDLAIEGGGFQEAVKRRRGVSAIRSLSARKHSDIEINVEVKVPKENVMWSYELIFNQDNRSRPVIKKEKIIKKENGGQKLILDRPLEEDRSDQERLRQTHLEQVTMNQSFRDLSVFFSSVQYLHIVPQLIREPDRSVGYANDPYGGDFLEQIAKTHEKTRQAWLRKIHEALKVAIPQLKSIELWRDERGTPHLRGKYEHWRPQGAWQTEEQFSDGTLRLIGLLWALLSGRGPLLLEEPELSLHPEVVKYIPQMFARMQLRTNRQIIVTTHSPELLKDQGIGLDEVILLYPKREGTEAKLASTIDEAKSLLEAGIPLDEIMRVETQPERAFQLSLFPENVSSKN